MNAAVSVSPNRALRMAFSSPSLSNSDRSRNPAHIHHCCCTGVTSSEDGSEIPEKSGGRDPIGFSGLISKHLRGPTKKIPGLALLLPYRLAKSQDPWLSRDAE